MPISNTVHLSFIDPTTGAPAVEPRNPLGFNCEHQGASRWCWAAVSVSLRSFLRRDLPPLEQCKLVEKVLPGDLQCCGGAVPDACNQTALLSTASAEAGVNTQSRGGTVLFSDIRDKIDAHQLVPCQVDFPPPFLRHFVVVDGYFEGDEDRLSVQDPQRGSLTMSVAAFRGNYNGENGTWIDTFDIL